MTKIKLTDLVKKKGISHVAQKLGCSPPAISKAIKANREIYVTVSGDEYRAKELKDFPSVHQPEKPIPANQAA